MQKQILPLFYILVLVGAAAGLFAGYQRYRVEQHNRRVELAIEYAEVKALATASHKPITQVLQRLKKAGVSSIAITEDTLASLEAQGEVDVNRYGLLTIVGLSPRIIERVERNLSDRGFKLTPVNKQLFAQTHETATVLVPRVAFDRSTPVDGAFSARVLSDYAPLRSLGVGLDTEAMETTKKAGLIPIARINNFPGANAHSMASILDGLRRQGIKTVIFQGLEVFGFRGMPKEAADALNQKQILYGSIEFGKQKGDESLERSLKGEFIRVHSISDGEMGTLDDNEIIDRFQRAARERNIRLCYIRFLTLVGDDPLEINAKYLETIAKGIQRGTEFELGQAHIFEETAVPRWIFPIIALGVASGLILIILRLVPLSTTNIVLIAAGSILVCVAITYLLGETGQKIIALLAALVFPTLACLRRDLLEKQEPVSEFATVPVLSKDEFPLKSPTEKVPSTEEKTENGVPETDTSASETVEAVTKPVPEEKSKKSKKAASTSTPPIEKPIAAEAPHPKTNGVPSRRPAEGMSIIPPLKSPPVLNTMGYASLQAILGFLLSSLVTFLGIFHVIGLLATRSFMMKVNQFMGIKVAHALPLLFIALLAIVTVPSLDRSWQKEKKRLLEHIRGIWQEPARIGTLLLALIGLMVFSIIVARTGNEPGVGVSGFELKFRALLDAYLPVRPRTKEFLIGHPAFILGLAFWFRGRRKEALPLFVIGVLGQVSILNTFCHIHTPLHLSLIRDLTGMVCGMLIGLGVFWGIETIAGRQKP